MGVETENRNFQSCVQNLPTMIFRDCAGPNQAFPLAVAPAAGSALCPHPDLSSCRLGLGHYKELIFLKIKDVFDLSNKVAATSSRRKALGMSKQGKERCWGCLSQ